MFTICLLACIVQIVTSHSWMTCPPSFMNGNVGRGGEQDNTCENDGRSAFVTNVEAGDRLKTGWTSNNHAGGFVRLSLVPFGQQNNEEVLKKNVLKFVCYGHDTRPHKTIFGDCKHPCDARPGCEYQNNQYDIHRFDTTITIPTNLKEGFYVLQAAMLVGNTAKPYNSCAKLYIRGGNPSFNCERRSPILTYSCLKSGGPALKNSIIEAGSARGDFCYHLDGTIGEVDDFLTDVPINVECDPRLSCANSVDPSCVNVEGMTSILTPNLHPRKSNCHVWSRLPDAKATCQDGIRNRDEEKVDCGGSFCEPCPFVEYKGAYYSAIKKKLNLWNRGEGGMITITVSVARNITQDQCWHLNLQFKVPISIDNDPWGAGMLVEQHEDRKIIQFESHPWHSFVGKGSELSLTMQCTNIALIEARANGASEAELDKLRWNDENLEFLTALFDVHDDKSKCSGVKAKPF